MAESVEKALMELANRKNPDGQPQFLMLWEDCPHCAGKGFETWAEKDRPPATCRGCHGSGKRVKALADVDLVTMADCLGWNRIPHLVLQAYNIERHLSRSHEQAMAAAWTVLHAAVTAADAQGKPSAHP